MTYNELLLKYSPSVPDTKEEFENIVTKIKTLIGKSSLTKEEAKICQLLNFCIGEFARKPIAGETPNEKLVFLMDKYKVKQKDLKFLGSRGVVSEIVSGKREIPKKKVKLLATFFGVPAEVFL